METAQQHFRDFPRRNPDVPIRRNKRIGTWHSPPASFVSDSHSPVADACARVQLRLQLCERTVDDSVAAREALSVGLRFPSVHQKRGNARLKLHSQTIPAIVKEYAVRRKQARRTKLRLRVSSGARRSLGWIPFKASAIRYRNGQLFFASTPLSL